MKIDGNAVTPVYGPYGGVYYAAVFGPLAAGSHALAIQATDSKGVSSTYNSSFDVLPATVTGPTISSVVVAESDPPKNGILETSEKLVATWGVTSPNGVATHSLKIDGNAVTPLYGPYGGLYYAGVFGPLTAGSHTIAIQATDGLGVSSSYSGTFDVVGITAQPTDIALSNNSVADNAVTGSLVGNLTATGSVAGDVYSFSLTNNAGGRFAVSGKQLYVADPASLAAGNYNVTVRATGSPGLTYDKQFAITVTSAGGQYGLAWAMRAGGTGADAGHNVATDATGNVYVSGAFEGPVDFDPGAGTTSLDGYAFAAKYNSAGAGLGPLADGLFRLRRLRHGDRRLRQPLHNEQFLGHDRLRPRRGNLQSFQRQCRVVFRLEARRLRQLRLGPPVHGHEFLRDRTASPPIPRATSTLPADSTTPSILTPERASTI